MESQIATDLMGSMNIQFEGNGAPQGDPAIACAVVCCCAVATVCLLGCLLVAEEQLV